MDNDLSVNIQKYQDRIKKAKQSFSDARSQNWPLHLDLDINHSCNAACSICYRRTSLNQQNGKMSWGLFVKLIKEGRSWGLMSVNLDHGGEPLLHPKLDRYIAFAHTHGVESIMLHTNALALTPSLSKRIIESGLSRISFSLDAATALTYSQQRGNAQDFNRVNSNILSFLDIREKHGHNLPFVQVSFVITKVNKEEQTLFFEQWRHSVDDVHFRKFNDPALELSDMLSCSTLIDKSKIIKNSFPYCTLLNWRLSVRWDGIVFPCCNPNGYLIPIGDANKQSIHDIWTGTQLSRIVSDHRTGQLKNYRSCQMCLTQAPDYIKY